MASITWSATNWGNCSKLCTWRAVWSSRWEVSASIWPSCCTFARTSAGVGKCRKVSIFDIFNSPLLQLGPLVRLAQFRSGERHTIDLEAETIQSPGGRHVRHGTHSKNLQPLDKFRR
jgi:hypothetical protein